MIDTFAQFNIDKYTKATICKVEKFAQQGSSDRIKSVANNALNKLETTVSSMQAIDRVTRKVPTRLQRLIKMSAGLFLKLFKKDYPLITSSADQRAYEKKLKDQLEIVAQEEMEQLATSLVQTAKTQKETRNNANAVALTLESELFQSFLNQSEQILAPFPLHDQLRISLQSLQQALDRKTEDHPELKFRLRLCLEALQSDQQACPPSRKPLKFHLNLLFSNLETKALKRFTPSFDIKPKELSIEQKKHLVCALSYEQKAIGEEIERLEKVENRSKAQADALRSARKRFEKIEERIKIIEVATQDNPLSVGPIRWSSLEKGFGSLTLPEELLTIAGVEPLKAAFAERSQLLEEIETTFSLIPPFTDPLQLDNEAIPLTIKKKVITCYCQSVQQSSQRPSLAQINHLYCLLNWLQIHDGSPEIVAQTHSYLEQLIDSIDPDQILKQKQISQDERDLIYLAQVIMDRRDKNLDKIVDPRLQQKIIEYTLALSCGPQDARRLDQFSKTKLTFNFNPYEYKEQIGVLQKKIHHLRDFEESSKLIKKLNEALKNQNHEGDSIGLAAQPSGCKKKWITLQELGRLEDMKDAYDILCSFKFSNYKGSDAWIKKIDEIGSSAQQLYQTIEQQAQKEAAQIYPGGALALYDYERRIRYKPRTFSLELKLTKLFIGRFTHASKIYKKDKNTLEISHVEVEYDNDTPTLRQLLLNNFYRIKIAALIKPEIKELIERTMPDDFWNEVQKEYERIENWIHGELQGNFELIENPTRARWMAGLASLRPFHFLRNLGSKEEGGFKKIRDQLLSQELPANTGMTCSEFVARSTTAALVELDQWLQKQLRDKGIEVKVDILGMGALQIPIDALRRYETILPKELYSLYSAVGAIEPLPHPPVLRSLIKEFEEGQA